MTDQSEPAADRTVLVVGMAEHIASVLRLNRYRLWRSQDVNDAAWDNVAREAAVAAVETLDGFLRLLVKDAAWVVLERPIEPGMGGAPEPVWETYKPEGVAVLIANEAGRRLREAPARSSSEAER